MSSLAATQADGYYLPVAYFDSGAYKRKKQSKNQWDAAAASPSEQSPRGGNTKQQRARIGHNQYERNAIVRFELPYDGICNHCRMHIKRGTRYNARKATVGAYHTTPIHEFQMNCRSCAQQTFVIQTNPAAFGFDYVSGIRKQVRDFAEPDDGCVTKAEGERRGPVTATAPEFLEQRHHQQQQERTELEELQQLQQLQQRQFYDAQHNSQLRSQFRIDRHKKHRQLAQGAALGWGPGLALLEDGTIDEEVASKTTIFGPECRTKERHEWRKLHTTSIFSTHTSSSSSRRRKRSRSNASESQPDAVFSNPQGSSIYRTRRKQAVVEKIDLTRTAEPEQRPPKPRKRIVPLVTREQGVIILATLSDEEEGPATAAVAAVPPANTSSGALEALLANYDSSSGEED